MPKKPTTQEQQLAATIELFSEALRDAEAALAVDDQGWTRELNVHQLLGRWPALVGGVNAEHCEPESYSDRVLTIRAESSTWAASLRSIAPQLVAVLNEQLGQGTVSRVVVVGPQAPSWKKGPRSVPGRGPRDTYG